MPSPTNYDIPTHIAEGLARYNCGEAELEEAIPKDELSGAYNVLEEITNPSNDIYFAVGDIAGHNMLLIDDHSMPKSNVSVVRLLSQRFPHSRRVEYIII